MDDECVQSAHNQLKSKSLNSEEYTLQIYPNPTLALTTIISFLEYFNHTYFFLSVLSNQLSVL